MTGPDAGRHPDAFTLHHVQPLSRSGDLLDKANARSVHRRCNTSRGNRTSVRVQGSSRRW
ncbi:HNH endonuclease [Streptomyces sp. NBC_00162]|uniref:HNH endonuclease n=1 Tax=Streptomyces sp. NBC_00162 TaxID=2903629 RepID=UPI002AFFD18B|nr:HNH endonuclease [Streptomyces sp. NBC_00162]